LPHNGGSRRHVFLFRWWFHCRCVLPVGMGFSGWCVLFGFRRGLYWCWPEVIDMLAGGIGSAFDPVAIATGVGDDSNRTYPLGLEPASRMMANQHSVAGLECLCRWSGSYVPLLVPPLVAPGPLMSFLSCVRDGTAIPFPLPRCAEVKAQEEMAGCLAGGSVLSPAKVEEPLG
jgi:hypothetical protein